MKKIGIYILTGIFILIGLKSCIVSQLSIDDYILLERKDERGQKDRVILTPKEEMIYIKEYNNLREVGIYKIKGEKATHYMFGLYLVGNFPFGLRYYTNAEKVFNAKLLLKDKSGSSFPKIGNSYNSKIVIFKDKGIIGDKDFKRNKKPENKDATINNFVKSLKSKIN